jgi:hypothetical protein
MRPGDEVPTDGTSPVTLTGWVKAGIALLTLREILSSFTVVRDRADEAPAKSHTSGPIRSRL